MFIILFFAIGLVAWSLHLLQEAIYHREFSLGLAGTLVASAAVATIGVYFLMANCMGHLNQMSASATSLQRTDDYYSSVLSDENLSTEAIWYGGEW